MLKILNKKRKISREMVSKGKCLFSKEIFIFMNGKIFVTPNKKILEGDCLNFIRKVNTV